MKSSSRNKKDDDLNNVSRSKQWGTYYRELRESVRSVLLEMNTQTTDRISANS